MNESVKLETKHFMSYSEESKHLMFTHEHKLSHTRSQ